MRFMDTGFADLFLIELDLNRDERGYFARTFCTETFTERGLHAHYPQCGTSFNAKSGTVRGMHFQKPPHGEVKLIRCTRGAIHDVVIDLRPASATYLKHYQAELAEGDGRELYVPNGFAHGFQTLEDVSEVHYMLSARYVPEAAGGLRWDDPAVSLSWPLPIAVISDRDLSWPLLDARPSAVRNQP
jgi:dTDP-4-dehydrorhamnose 3,5-epimerase